MMDTEQNFTNGSEQHTFLTKHLATVNRSRTPWLIFTGHRLVCMLECFYSKMQMCNFAACSFRPMYVDSTQVNPPDGMQPVAKLMRDNLEYLLKVCHGLMVITVKLALKYGVEIHVFTPYVSPVLLHSGNTW